MGREIQGKLLEFWQRGVRGADFFISAIGPALSVYGRYETVERPDGSVVTVEDFLELVRRESTAVALRQVLQGADLGKIDSATQTYLTWTWSYGKAPLDAGEAHALCLATGADIDVVTRRDAVAEMKKEGSKKLVRLKSIAGRARDEEHLGRVNGGKSTALIDELQWAAYLWGANRGGELAEYRNGLGEERWRVLKTLGQAVAECLPEGDDDRRLVRGLLGSNVMGTARPAVAKGSAQESMDLG